MPYRAKQIGCAFSIQRPATISRAIAVTCAWITRRLRVLWRRKASALAGSMASIRQLTSVPSAVAGAADGAGGGARRPVLAPAFDLLAQQHARLGHRVAVGIGNHRQQSRGR